MIEIRGLSNSGAWFRGQSLLLLPLAGVWFILYATLFLLYDPLNKALGIEEQIARRYSDQTPHYD